MLTFDKTHLIRFFWKCLSFVEWYLFIL